MYMNNLTYPFTILEPEDQETGEFWEGQERRATDFEAPKLWKGSVGNSGKYIFVSLCLINAYT